MERMLENVAEAKEVLVVVRPGDVDTHQVFVLRDLYEKHTLIAKDAWQEGTVSHRDLCFDNYDTLVKSLVRT